MLWWIIATLCAYFVKGVCGFASTLVFTSILSFGSVSNVGISPVDLMLGYPSNILMVWKRRRSIRWRVCLPLIALVIAGIIPGALFLRNADAGMIKAAFGAVIVLLGIEMLWRELRPGKVQQSNKAVLGVIGLVSGLLCGLYGVGALLSAYISRVTEDRKAFQGNLCLVFLVESTFRIAIYTAWGILTLDALRRAAMLLPFMLSGLCLGLYCGKFINERLAKLLVVAALVISGVMLTVQNLP